MTEEDFLDHKWQARNSITKPAKLLAALQDLVPQSFYDDVVEGFSHSPMSVRVSPYLLSLIDWNDPYNDPLRTQFIPVASRLLPNHPKLTLDSLGEQADAPVPGMTHRYEDKALFLALDTCPVYCRFCTRSYAVGINTEDVEKVSLKAKDDRWDQVFRYIAARPELEDIVISGGDTYQLKARQIQHIGDTLLGIDQHPAHAVRHQRAWRSCRRRSSATTNGSTRSPSVADARACQLHKEVVVHTHFNHPNEITAITKRAQWIRLFERGITVRNQSVHATQRQRHGRRS